MTRRQARKIRCAISQEKRHAKSNAVKEHILSWEMYRDADTVMAYASYGCEVETMALLDTVLRQGKRLVLPRCLGSGRMEAKAVLSLDSLRPGTLGILEPREDAATVDPASIGLILVPGLAFDTRGNRLGQGAGYYDRFLPSTRGFACGVAFAAQVADALAAQPHDVPVHALATEAGIEIISNNSYVNGGTHHG